MAFSRVLFFSFMLIAASSIGQNMVMVDSLRQVLRIASGKQRFDLLTAIGFEYRYSYPDSTIFYCNEAFELGEALELPKELSKPLSFSGLALANKGDYKRSLELHERAINVALQQNDSTQLAFGYNNLGRMFFDGGDLVRAYDNFIRAKEIFEVLNDKSGLAYVYRSLANIYKFHKDFPKALEMSTQAYQLRKELGDARALISSLLELGLIYQNQGNSELALAQFDEAERFTNRINDKVTLAELRMGRAEMLFETRDYTRARENAEFVLKTLNASTNQKLYLRATIIKGKIFFAQKDFNNSITWFQKVIEESDASGDIVFLRDASFYLAEIYKLQRQAEFAEDFTNRYKIYDEKLQNTDLTRQIERLQFLLQIENKEKENERLKLNEARNNEIIARQRLQNFLLLILILSLGALAGITLYNSRKRRKVNQQLAIQNKQIIQQRREIEHQNEILSKRNQQLSDLNNEKDTLMNIVAHDLKSPLNRIFGLVRIMEMTGELSSGQKEYLKLIKNATKSGSDLITDLLDVNSFAESSNAPKISAVNLEAIINEKVEAISSAAEAKQIKIDLSYTLPPEFITDAEYIERILDNMLTNAIKFSKLQSIVEVKGSYSNKSLILTIKDQGQGFSELDKQFLFQRFKKLSARPTAGESSNGLGLAIVKTLVDRLGGKIELVTEEGKGSEFIITIPKQDLKTN